MENTTKNVNGLVVDNGSLKVVDLDSLVNHVFKSKDVKNTSFEYVNNLRHKRSYCVNPERTAYLVDTLTQMGIEVDVAKRRAVCMFDETDKQWVPEFKVFDTVLTRLNGNEYNRLVALVQKVTGTSKLCTNCNTN